MTRAKPPPADQNPSAADHRDIDNRDIDRCDVDRCDIDHRDVDRCTIDHRDVDRRDVDHRDVGQHLANDRPSLHREGAALLRLGSGFFRRDSRPARDLGVLLAADLANRGPLRVLDVMAGCGIRSLRYGLEAGASQLWVNDADPDRLPLLRANLAQLPAALAWHCSSRTAHGLLASCLERRQRFELVDLDAFGCPSALVPLALEAVACGGLLYLNSSDGRSPTGHDRPAAVRRLGAAARCHPAAWELALRLQLGVLARAAWAQGRGLTPVLAFSDGRTFRTAVRLERRPAAREEARLGLLAHCHRCGEQQHQSLLGLDRWRDCGCGQATPLAVSGPLWIGPLQHIPTLERLGQLIGSNLGGWMDGGSARLLRRLVSDPGLPVHCWSMAELARHLGQGPPAREALLRRLHEEGFQAHASGVMPAQLRSDAPWSRLLELARELGDRREVSPVSPGGAQALGDSREPDRSDHSAGGFDRRDAGIGRHGLSGEPQGGGDQC